MIYLFTAGNDDAGKRLDVWLHAMVAAEMDAGGEGGGDGFSRARGQQLIKEGFVRFKEVLGGSAEVERGNKEVERWVESRNPAKKVRAGEVFEVEVPPVEELEIVGEDIPLEVLFEDAHLLVINKPAGMTVHPAPGNWTGTLVHALVHHCKNGLSGINGVARPGIVHRLDKDTSGIMVVAKDDRTHRGLARQLANHSMHRVYEALCRGVPVPRAGTIEGSIGRHPKDRVRRAVVRSGGKEAVTHYRVLEGFGQSAAHVELRLETGRTHQIRVHMAHRRHPLLGDPMYGVQGPLQGLDEAAQARVKNIGRQMLHARELGFVHPITGEELSFTAQAPVDMAEMLEFLRKTTAV